MDNDGDMDIVTVSSATGRFYVCFNDRVNMGHWPFITLTNTFGRALSVIVDDLDNDGDMDIVSAASSGKLIWWENQTPV